MRSPSNKFPCSIENEKVRHILEENICETHTRSGLSCRKYKELSKFNNKKANNTMGKVLEQTFYQRRYKDF
jgi:hypothetical protein